VKSKNFLITLLFLLILVFQYTSNLFAQCGGGPCRLCNITTTIENISGGTANYSVSVWDENILAGQTANGSALALEMTLGDTMTFDVQMEYTWQQGVNVSWMHGFSLVNMDEWWIINAFPSSQDSGWVFMEEVTGKCSGRTYGPGFFWDPVGDSCPPEGNRSHWDGENCFQSYRCEGEEDYLIDGDPSDNWGLNCTTDCPSFIFRLRYIADKRGTDTMELRFQLVEDGETGAWTHSNNCVFEFVIPVLITVHDPDYPKGAVFCQPEPTEIKEVINSTTGRIWMDRNLGAERSAYFSRDRQAYGDLYQWGRFSDGHQCRESETIDELADLNQPGHPYFIISPDSLRDWRTVTNNNLWQRLNKVNNPCPEDFRPPTMAEWVEEVDSWSGRGALAAAKSVLSLPLAGIRSVKGEIAHNDRWGQYWSSTVSGNQAASLAFAGNVILQRSSPRAQGMSLRCIRDDGPVASVVLNKRASPTSFSGVGQIITFTFEVVNNGEAPLLNLIVTDADFGWTFDPVNLEPGQSTTFFRAYFTSLQDILNGGIANHAEVSGFSDEGEEVFGEDEVFVPFQPQSPLFLKKGSAFTEPEFRIYPNPASGWVNIDISGLDTEQEIHLKIFNSVGKMVQRELISSQITEINVNHLLPGLYLLGIFDNNSSRLGEQYLIIH